MAITQTQTTSFKVELYQGVHALDVDTVMIALYTSDADLGAATTEYTTTGEVVADGYVAGGAALTGASVSSSGQTAWVSFSTATWSGVFTARGALLYNASKANRAIAVLDFGSDRTSSSGVFTVAMPVASASTALIRSA